jgi:hypothetical protein
MKEKKCIKCKIRIHPSDWFILKEMSSLPICDKCLFTEEKNANGQVSINQTNDKQKNVVFFPKKFL